jgi:hypothetical protein
MLNKLKRGVADLELDCDSAITQLSPIVRGEVDLRKWS